MNKQNVACLFLAIMVFTSHSKHLLSEQAVNRPAETPISCLQKMVHNVHNLETELGYLKQKIDNQETKIESLRDEVVALLKATKELNTKSQDTQSERLAKLEKNFEKLITDMKQFKTHANETADAIAAAQKSLQEQVEQNKLQGKQMQDMESATKSLVKAMQNKISQAKESFNSLTDSTTEKPTTSQSNHYYVKSGDTLAKIAKEFKTSSQKLKELNGLKSDKITTGQQLLLPNSEVVQ